MSECKNNVDFWVDELTRNTDPEYFGLRDDSILYMHNNRFGKWMWSIGYNDGLANLQEKVNTYCVPQWISVEDRLPEPSTPVLVYIPNIGIRTDWTHPYEGRFFTYKSNCITHWMSLPEPPIPLELGEENE